LHEENIRIHNEWDLGNDSSIHLLSNSSRNILLVKDVNTFAKLQKFLQEIFVTPSKEGKVRKSYTTVVRQFFLKVWRIYYSEEHQKLLIPTMSETEVYGVIAQAIHQQHFHNYAKYYLMVATADNNNIASHSIPLPSVTVFFDTIRTYKQNHVYQQKTYKKRISGASNNTSSNNDNENDCYNNDDMEVEQQNEESPINRTLSLTKTPSTDESRKKIKTEQQSDIVQSSNTSHASSSSYLQQRNVKTSE
jgi:hypothetical protein